MPPRLSSQRPVLMGVALLACVCMTSCAGSVTAGRRPAGGLISQRVAAPALSGTTLAGRPQSLAALLPDVVVLNFYASWCEPCKAEAPFLSRVATTEAVKGVSVLGILEQDSPSNGRGFARRYAMAYPTVIDGTGALLHRFRLADVGGIPVTLVIDRRGRVAARWLGPITSQAAFRSVIDTLAAEPRT